MSPAQESSERALRVGVIDDHPLIRGGVERIIAQTEDMELVFSLGSAQEFEARPEEPDVIDLEGTEPALDAIRTLSERCRILIVSASSSGKDVLAAVQAGAAGYLTKQASEPLTPSSSVCEKSSASETRLSSSARRSRP